MKTFTHGLCLLSVVLILGLMGVAGCGADNETEADKLAKGLGDPGAVNPKAVGAERSAPPTSQAEFKERADAQAKKNFGPGSGYPGGSKAKN